MPAAQLTNNNGAITPTNPIDVTVRQAPDAGAVVQRTNQVTLATAGTRQRLSATSVPLVNKVVYLKAWYNNSNVIYVGGPDVAQANGYRLAAGEEVFVYAENLTDVWIDAGANTQIVQYIAS